MFRPRRLHGPCRLLRARTSSRSVISGVSLRPRAPPRTSLELPQTRAKKTTTTVKLSDLPQGPLGAEQITTPAEGEQQDAPAYPTVVLQAWRNMRQFDKCVLLTRVGGFYELYFEHAQEYAPLLNLKLATKKTNAGPVPMVGHMYLAPLHLPLTAHIVRPRPASPSSSWIASSRSSSRT